MLNQRLDDFARVFEELSATFNQIPAAHQCLTAAVTIIYCLCQKGLQRLCRLPNMLGDPLSSNLLGYGGAIGVAEKKSRIGFGDLPEQVVNTACSPTNLQPASMRLQRCCGWKPLAGAAERKP